jgi:hypothetical protein
MSFDGRSDAAKHTAAHRLPALVWSRHDTQCFAMSSDPPYASGMSRGSVTLIAVEEASDAEPLSAILVETRRGRRWLIEWWGGYASQTLSGDLRPADVLAWPGWRPFTIEIPQDWEEGYLRSERGQVEFVYGRQPDPRLRRSKPA